MEFETDEYEVFCRFISNISPKIILLKYCLPTFLFVEELWKT